MLAAIKRRLKDMGVLKQLLLKAEAIARAEGVPEPGSEHLVMAALTLEDETASRAFCRVDADPSRFAAAVAQQYADALRRIGVAVGGPLMTPDGLPEPGENPGPFKSRPSARTLIRRLAKDRPFGASTPLLGADVVLAALSSDIGTVARALAVMGVQPGDLADACRLEIGLHGNAR